MKRIIGLTVINIAVIALLGILTPYFLTKANLVVMVDNMALEVVILSGYTLLLISGNFDLSIDGIAALSGITAGIMMTNGVNWVLAIIVALLLSGTVGIINGIVVSKLHINGLIATLTSWWICIGVSLGITKALAPYNFPEAFQLIGQARVFGFRILVFYALVSILILSFVLHMTPLGVHIYATGGNSGAAVLMGIDIIKLGIGTYLLVGLLAGFIGIVTAARLNAASPFAVDGMALRVIAAIVIGGGKLSGGEGTIIGGLLGLCLMTVLSNAMIQLGISPYWQKAILGSILLVAVLSEKLNLNRQRRIEA